MADEEAAKAQRKKERKEAKKRAAEAAAAGEPEAKRARGDAAEGEAAAAAEGEISRLRIPIAYPFSEDHENLTKKLLKLVKDATQQKGMVRGIKEVTKLVRKDKAGDTLVILAADVSPLDCIAHMPVLLENKEVPYIWVPSRHDLGTAALSKRPTSTIMIRKVSDEKADTLRKVKKIVAKMHTTLVPP
eukprot:TRINITY_DN15771_c0_g1_i1.p3 TRINITY_DN15771_c0_g1~~TRINITY_DN15771_c0_g1_i1.p3  ORF type:complete len:188 (+),score=96.91 TRINITY_DN15771_c0_g1_i1:88-651(+)